MSNVTWGKLAELVPGIKITLKEGTVEEPMALQFVDTADGEEHVFVFGEDGKKNLVEQLTGGIILPIADGRSTILSANNAN